MSDIDNIGKLMYLPLEDIEPDDNEFSAPEFIINAAAESILKANGRNWLPIIVKEIAEYQYQVVANPLVYAVAQKAQLERVWCIVIDPTPDNINQVNILTGETAPKVNLNTASEETITAALKYLKNLPDSPLKSLNIITASQKIAKANRESWKDFKNIPTLKCGITTGNKLNALKQVFYCEPIAKLEPPPSPEKINIKKASREQIFECLNYLTTYQIDGFEAINPDQVADQIFTASKSKWRSLNPISQLNCGISKAKITTLKTLFSVI